MLVNANATLQTTPKYQFVEHGFIASRPLLNISIQQSWSIKTVKLNRVFTECPAPILIWMAGRLLDCQDGSGHVTTTYQELADLLNKTVPTIKRYVRQAKQLGYLQRVISERGSQGLQLYLASGSAICHLHGFSVIGPRFELDRDMLRLGPAALRCIATEAEAKHMQNASRYAAKKADSTVEPLSNPFQSVEGVMQQKSSRFIRVSPDTITYGASQATIANRMNRSERTVQRRLSKERRERVGLNSLDRIQVLRALPLTAFSAERTQALMRLGTVVNTTNGQGLPIKICFRQFSKPKLQDQSVSRFDAADFIAFQYCPNLYDSDLPIFSDRRLSRALKQPSRQNKKDKLAQML